MIKKVLIFRLGSLGDTVVALPCFHLIARTFPNSERRLLTSLPVNDRVISPSAVLEHTGLVHGYMTYSPKRSNILEFLRLLKKIKQWGPDVLIYLAEPRSPISAWRDALYFKWCGIKQLIGVPYTKEMRENRWLSDKIFFEPEPERLVRCLKDLGNTALDQASSWDLKLTGVEKEHASRCLEHWAGKDSFLVCHAAAKIKSKDWGGENWSRLFSRLSQDFPDLGLVMIGGLADREVCTERVKNWKGKTLNLCGRLTPRQSAAVMKQALFYLGHDSGPMHLAAAAGLPCVSIFVECKKPGIWFPYGSEHKVLYRGESNDEVFWEAKKIIEERFHATI